MMSSWRDTEGVSYRWYAEVGSTNDVARDWACVGEEDCGVVWAREQTAGRGRRGNVWLCPAGEGVAFSFWTRPTLPRGDWPLMALMAAWSISEVLRDEWGVNGGIKWPNDVWIDGKKLAGILVEIVDDVVIIGIGINANVKIFPQGMEGTATSIFLQSGMEVDPRDLIEKIIACLRRALSELESHRGRLMDQVRSRCVLRGRWVRLKTQGEEREIEVIGIGDRGELWVMHHGQPEAIWQADEIRPLL